MLIWDPVFRPTARDCLNHPYFAELRKTDYEVEKQVGLDSIPNYVGPNHDSENIFKRNKAMIAEAV